jgi:putative ABC transport system permease protein
MFLPGLVLLLTGSVLALPGIIRPLLGLLGALPLGLEFSLALSFLRRHPMRTGFAAAILFLALVVTLAFGHCVRDISRDVQHWYRHTIVADYLIRGSLPDITFSLAAALPETIADEIRGCDGVAAIDKITFLPAQANGLAILVLARTFTPDRPLPLDLEQGEEAEVRRSLAQGEVVIGKALAQQLNLRQGDTLTLATIHGPCPLRIAGVATEYAGGGLAAYLEWHCAQHLLEVPGVHVFLVHTFSGVTPNHTAAFQEYCQRRHLLLQSNSELSGGIDLLVRRITTLLWALMALAFVVSSLGAANTLMMNGLDQTTDLGILRALGLTRGQVRKLMRTQALLLAGSIILPGVVAGVGLAYLLNRTSASWGGTPAPFHLDAFVIGLACTLVPLVALLAALVPARRAARLSVTAGIHSV